MEALTFLVNNLNKDIDFKNLREAFRALDKNNTGILTATEIREALRESHMPMSDLEEIFKGLDYYGDGHINYSVFLAATVDK